MLNRGILPQENSAFVARMEQVSDVYKRPYCTSNPVVCMDESPKQLIKEIAEVYYPNADKITLVMDNLNTHYPPALYETFSPNEAKRLWDRFEFVYTPKHGSWLNIAEIELNVIHSQCLSGRIDKIEEVSRQVKAWQDYRNNKKETVNWQFKTDDARIKLKNLYPSIEV